MAEEIDHLLSTRLSPTAYLEQAPAIQELVVIASRYEQVMWSKAIEILRAVPVASGEDYNEFHGLIVECIERLESASKE